MTSFRLKQIALVLFVMASLLSASPAACACSHHEETKAVESDCHSQHGSAQASEIVKVIDESCVCVAYQRQPFAVSKSANKELKAVDAVSEPDTVVSVPEFAALVIRGSSTPGYASDDLHSNTLRSLLPARAPPRL